MQSYYADARAVCGLTTKNSIRDLRRGLRRPAMRVKRSKRQGGEGLNHMPNVLRMRPDDHSGRQRSHDRFPGLDDADVANIKGMLARGDRQSDIAAFFGVNSGRIAEINTGSRKPEVRAADPETLPPAGPYLVGRSALTARDTLVALRDLIDQTLQTIDLYEGVKE